MGESSSTVVAEQKPNIRPPQPALPDAETRYQRRASFLGNPRAKLALGLGALILIVGGIFAWRYFTSYEATDDAQIDGHINSVSARISGHVIKLNVEDNQYVERGTVLVEIDPADYEIAASQAR